MKRLTCFNHYGIGDLFESREFVLEWMRVLGVSECEYACRYPAVFEDLPQIKTRELTEEFHMRWSVGKRAGRYLLNTWVGARNAETKPKGDYVLWPGVGCTVEHIYRMHSDYMHQMGLKRITKPPQDFLTTVDYDKINIGGIPEFLQNRGGCRLVLVCNGPTGSGHAVNFDMAAALPIREWSNTLYILTERVQTDRPDIVFTDDITNRNERADRCDVLAISYLSRFCNVIVGRCSGAQMVTETKENWMNPNKTLVSFTQHNNGASFVLDPVALGLKMRRVWSGASTPEEAAEVLRNILTPPESIDGKSAYMKQIPGNIVLD